MIKKILALLIISCLTSCAPFLPIPLLGDLEMDFPIEDPDNLEVLGKVEASPKNQTFLIEENRVYMRLNDPEIYDCGDVVTVVRKVKKKVRHPIYKKNLRTRILID